MQIVFLLYDGMTALDAVGPHEILCRLPGVSIKRVAKSLELGIEYDPKPPFNVGSPEKADPELLESLRERMVSLFESE